MVSSLNSGVESALLVERPRTSVPESAASAARSARGRAEHVGQQEKLRALLAAVMESNRFYRQKFEHLEINPDSLTVEQYRASVPFTRKAELVEDQQAHPPYGCDLTFPLSHYTRCHQTSGTKGVAMRWLDTPESWDSLLVNWRQIFGAAGVAATDRLFFAFSFGPFLGFWSAFEAALRLGCFCFPGGAMDTRTRLQAIKDHQITVLCCTPTYALRLGEAAREVQESQTRRIKTIITAGEPGGSIPATRARLEALWPNARVFDHYGMTEVGPASYECPAQPGVLHLIDSAYFAEVIDPISLEPVELGQRGELVLTTLDRIASPLLRYRTGDLVKPRPSGCCLCGTCDTALEGGILGRTDDMVIIKGVNVYPSAIENLLRGLEGLNDYRVLLETRDSMLDLSIEIEPTADFGNSAELVQQAEHALHTAFLMRVPVKAVSPGTLPQFEMKARRWVRAGAV